MCIKLVIYHLVLTNLLTTILIKQYVYVNALTLNENLFRYAIKNKMNSAEKNEKELVKRAKQAEAARVSFLYRHNQK